MKFELTIVLLFFSLFSYSQSNINGVIKNKKGNPIFAANIYLKSSPQKGVISDLYGAFSLNIINSRDTLIVSFIGYRTKMIRISNIDITKNIIIILKEDNQTLEEVIIKARDPISEKFSVVKMKKIDIYLNPVSQGDPLKAITILPASTTTDETANPSLRGSSANRTRVILNGVPIYNPVRASQLNNQGFFSLFNPEIISKQYVYASNPPLTYGNTSAGLVEIQTIKDLETNQLQLSTTLGSVGILLSQRIKKGVSFIQIYGNYQFSDAFVGVQKDKLPSIKNFYTKDAGINFHTKIGKNAEFNSYNYFINEQFDGYNQKFTFKGNLATDKRRIFTVNNLKLYSEKGVLSINSGTNNSKQHYSFGNIKSEQKISQTYSSIDYKNHLLENINIQFGISHDYHYNKFKDSIPSNYYALSPNSSNYYLGTSNHNHIIEAYIYTNWKISEKFTFSLGMRSNLPVKNQKYYFSSQLDLKYRLSKKQSFLLSSGKYHNYSIPNYYSKTYNLLSSYQLALDYSYKLKNTLLKAATYFKNETGGQPAVPFFIVDRINTFGIEFYIEHDFCKYFKFTFSNSFIDQKMRILENDYHGAKDFNYLVKTTVQYNNPKLFSLALVYMGRPGTYYNEITSSTFDKQTSSFIPIFSNDLYNMQYGNYNRFDLSLSKYIRIRNNALIIFMSINNIFNKKNEGNTFYNASYSKKHFDYFQFRTVYFGVVWQLNY